MPTVVDAECCIACGACVDICPENVYDLKDVAVTTRKEECTDCGLCIDECPSECIDYE
ncbi:MAG: 4Fe-4S binding protein [Candidatus Heimdallarchaeota archaeon]|nr:4Fe-4S dicluster domain-containing protein [Candidatus Heimdallarchaeota archaeon]MCG3258302.1 4Fe-4S binding protein [Candidatus Heimdallarchaeota archaeon]MCK5142327.1 4Fe-4S binding protein [Candidatus Heimdallarchaeota archaeon]